MAEFYIVEPKHFASHTLELPLPVGVDNLNIHVDETAVTASTVRAPRRAAPRMRTLHTVAHLIRFVRRVLTDRRIRSNCTGSYNSRAPGCELKRVKAGPEWCFALCS